MGRPRLQVGAVTITSEPARARALADFYHRLLGWPIVEVGPQGGWPNCVHPRATPGRRSTSRKTESMCDRCGLHRAFASTQTLTLAERANQAGYADQTNPPLP